MKRKYRDVVLSPTTLSQEIRIDADKHSIATGKGTVSIGDYAHSEGLGVTDSSYGLTEDNPSIFYEYPSIFKTGNITLGNDGMWYGTYDMSQEESGVFDGYLLAMVALNKGMYKTNPFVNYSLLWKDVDGHLFKYGGSYIDSYEKDENDGITSITSKSIFTPLDDNLSFDEGDTINLRLSDGATGHGSHTEGISTSSTGIGSHAEGYSSVSNGSYSHAEGGMTIANGNYSHAEGAYTVAYGKASHIEGFGLNALFSNISGSGESEGSMICSGELKRNADDTWSSVFDQQVVQDTRDHSGYLLYMFANERIGSESGSFSESFLKFLWVDDKGRFFKYGGSESESIVTWEESHLRGNTIDQYNPFTRSGITLSAGADSSANFAIGDIGDSYHGDINCGDNSGFTFTSSIGNLTQIEIHCSSPDQLKDGWSYDENKHKLVWEGDSSVVQFGMSVSDVVRITFTVGTEMKIKSKFTPIDSTVTFSTGDTIYLYLTDGTIGHYSHAEGEIATAIGEGSHAEGQYTMANENGSHAEGVSTKSSGIGSHSEGISSMAYGKSSHAEGETTLAIGNDSHAEGMGLFSESVLSENSEMFYSGILIRNSDGQTWSRTFIPSDESKDGYYLAIFATQMQSLSVDMKDRDSIFRFPWIDDSTGTLFRFNGATAKEVHSNGVLTALIITASFTPINSSPSFNTGDTILLRLTDGACGIGSHTEGSITAALGNGAHAEGSANLANKDCAHAEGQETFADGEASHTEGDHTYAKGSSSHSEGFHTQSLNNYEHSEGTYNVSIQGVSQHTVGLGNSTTSSNAHLITSDGKHYIPGVGGYIGTEDTSILLNSKKDLATVIGDGEPMESITWSVLKTKRDSSLLIPGKQYRITDYECTTTQTNTQSANHLFDIIVVADDVNKLNENARAIQRVGDTYFSSSNLKAWQLKYCLDNDTNRFVWADSTNGKGIIWYMKDEFENECYYDFKNIMFKPGAKTGPGTVANVFYYTFSVATGTNDSSVKDHSLNGRYCSRNKIGIYISSNKQKLSNNVFRNISTTNGCNNNIFVNDCNNNTFGYGCNNNTFGYGCNYNVFEYSCNNNTFGYGCGSNIFGYSCNNNTFWYGCGNNVFGSSCNYNVFGNNCDFNTLGDSCTYNVFGNNCGDNVFGSSCNNNTFGNYCQSIRFVNSASLSTKRNCYCYIIVENGNRQIYLDCTATTLGSAYYQNVKIAQGVNNTINYKTITDSNVNQNYQTVYQPANSQVISV